MDERDREMYLELRRGLLYAVKAIEKRLDLTAPDRGALHSTRTEPIKGRVRPPDPPAEV